MLSNLKVMKYYKVVELSDVLEELGVNIEPLKTIPVALSMRELKKVGDKTPTFMEKKSVDKVVSTRITKSIPVHEFNPSHMYYVGVENFN